MKIAVEGCCHGELDKIYETLTYLEQQNKIKVDLLIICGDFQAVRNRSDLQAMAVPQKYQKMNTFYKYYSGEKEAPVLTIFIGGNHEASNYLQELSYGGWVAPKIYYMGYAGVVKFGGVRIGGLSGIFKGRDHNKGHFEHPPYSDDTKRSCYHVRNLEVFRLKQMKQPVDILFSHDWPRRVYNHGNVSALLRRKKFFQAEVENETLGSPVAEELLHHLKPEYWFAAHLHVKFAAIVQHPSDSGSTKETKFLALDKCLPKRKFLQVIDIPTESDKPLELELDPEWLAILKSTNHLLNLSKGTHYMPGPGCSERWDFAPTAEEIASISEDFGGLFKIPDNFEKTVPAYDPKVNGKNNRADPPQITINPQTTLLCDMLGLTDPFAVFSGKQQHNNVSIHEKSSSAVNDSAYLDESSLTEDSDFINTTLDISSVLNSTTNPDEISLDDLDEDDQEEDDKVEAKDASPLPIPEKPVLEVLNNEIESNVLAEQASPSPLQSSLNVSMESTSSGSSGGKRNIDTENPPSSAPEKPRKFKRRNQSLYASGDDHDD